MYVARKFPSLDIPKKQTNYDILRSASHIQVGTKTPERSFLFLLFFYSFVLMEEDDYVGTPSLIIIFKNKCMLKLDLSDFNFHSILYTYSATYLLFISLYNEYHMSIYTYIFYFLTYMILITRVTL